MLRQFDFHIKSWLFLKLFVIKETHLYRYKLVRILLRFDQVKTCYKFKHSTLIKRNFSVYILVASMFVRDIISVFDFFSRFVGFLKFKATDRISQLSESRMPSTLILFGGLIGKNNDENWCFFGVEQRQTFRNE